MFEKDKKFLVTAVFWFHEHNMTKLTIAMLNAFAYMPTEYWLL